MKESSQVSETDYRSQMSSENNEIFIFFSLILIANLMREMSMVFFYQNSVNLYNHFKRILIYNAIAE